MPVHKGGSTLKKFENHWCNRSVSIGVTSIFYENINIYIKMWTKNRHCRFEMMKCKVGDTCKNVNVV